jgi:hypothetical protein
LQKNGFNYNSKTMTANAIQKMILYFENDIKRINHALKVYAFSNCIARSENLSDNVTLITDIAAVMHDIGIKEAEKKYNSCTGHYQEIEGPPVARELLSDLNISPAILDRICFLIGNHHSYNKIDGIDFQILVEADFLVNIFEDEIAKHSIETIREKYFKTKTGITIIESMYL